MSDAFTLALHAWQNFYFMSGGAAATLIGLLFIAISFGWHLVSTESDTQFRTYVTPILTHFISVLVLACMMLVPIYPAFGLSLVLLGLSIAGGIEIVRVIRGMSRRAQPAPVSMHHWFWNVILPVCGYGLVLSAAVWLAVRESPLVLYLIAVADVVLLLDGIWRAWETVVWIAHQPRPD